MILTFFPLGRKVHDRMEVNVLLELVINELLSIFCHCWTESSVRNRNCEIELFVSARLNRSTRPGQ